MGGGTWGYTHITPPSPIQSPRINATESIRMIVTIPEGVRRAYGRAYIRLKASEGLNTPMLFLIVLMAHCYIWID